jgi:hypothetical protein
MSKDRESASGQNHDLRRWQGRAKRTKRTKEANILQLLLSTEQFDLNACRLLSLDIRTGSSFAALDAC